MRTFETLLILVNLLAVLLRLRKTSKAVQLGSARLNLAVFCLHGFFEGLRYQMTFSYLFVVLLVVLTLVGPTQSESKPRKAIKVMAMGFSFVLLLFTSFLAHALPVFTLPEPTGSYDVGIQYFHLVDENRADPFLDTSTQKRELMVKVYYPAGENKRKPFAPYFHSPQLVRSFAAFYNLPGFAFDHLSLVKTNSKDKLELSDQQSSYPVILFSHGAGTTMEVQTSQSEDLASHGYIVVAIDHTYVSAATVFPDRVVSHKDATTDFHTPEPAEVITQIMADDSKFVIDTLGEMNNGKIDSFFEGKLNLHSIGAVGHSVGGAVAYHLALNDPRVKAAINLDGRVYITPKEHTENLAPFLMLASDTYHMQAIRDQKSLMKKFEDMTSEEQNMMLSMYGSKEAYQEAYRRDTQNVIELTNVLEASGGLFTIRGSDHMKFMDIGLFIGSPRLRELIGIRGKTNPARCLEITKAVTLMFFDRHLKGESHDSLESLLQNYSELEKVNLQ